MKRRLPSIILLGVLTFLGGYFFLGDQVIPASGMPLENWMGYFYALSGLSLVIGLAAAAWWFDKGLRYDAAAKRRIGLIYRDLWVISFLVGMFLGFGVLPAADEGSGVSRLWITILAPLIFYLDSVLAGAYPVQFMPPLSKKLYKKIFSKVSPRELEQDVRFQPDFFTEKLYLLPQMEGQDELLYSRKNLSLTWQGKKWLPVYPLQEHLLSYIDLQDLNEGVHFRFSAAGGHKGDSILVRLVLPGKDKRLAPLYFEKVYPAASVVTMPVLPVFSVWPDFELTGLKRWDRYYTYYDDAEESDLYVQPQKNWNLPDTLRRVETTGVGRKEIRCGSSYPACLWCSSKDEAVSYGILIPKPPERINITNKHHCTVSVDFGTTNTTICYSMKSVAPEPLSLKHKPRQFFALGSRRGLLHESFLPDEPVISCALLLSAFHSYNDLRGTREKMFQKGNIFFVNDASVLSSMKNVNTDLKWDLGSSELTEGFLEQLCTQCLAELAAKGATSVEWRFSYPKSFTVNEKNNFDAVRAKVLANLQKNTGLPEHPELEIECRMDEKFIVPESVALAAYYDQDYDANRSGGIICMDIGGGSTDLAFWYGDDPNITWQSSLRLAGQQIYRDMLFTDANIALYKELGLGEEFDRQIDELTVLAKRHLNTSSTEVRNIFGLRLDTLLKYWEKDISAAWKDGCLHSKGLKKIQRNILFAVSGLLYYAGMVFGVQYKNGAYSHLDRFHAVYIGGNGSKLLDLAAGGSYGQDRAEYMILAEMFRRGIRCVLGEAAFTSLLASLDFKTVTINKSRQPKKEVAYGLLCDDIAGIEKILERGGHTQVNTAAVAGEKFYEEENLAADGIITLEKLRHKLTVDPKLPFFKNFLTDLNEQTQHFLGYKMNNIYSEKNLAQIQEAVNKVLADKRLQQDGDVAVEPLFALILHKAMDLLAVKVQQDTDENKVRKWLQ